ncbi:hypothetical protein XaC1_87 [Xanthomonas phage XaC1]|nr:hypothetical protein XaC1_87 [Xanthomonas phage XaC1]
MKKLSKKIKGLQYLIDFSIDIALHDGLYYHNPSKQGRNGGVFVNKNQGYQRELTSIQFRDNSCSQWHPVFSLSVNEGRKNYGIVVLNKNQEIIINDVVYPLGMDKDDKFNFTISTDVYYLEWYEVLSRIKLPDEVHGFCLHHKMDFIECLNIVNKTKKQYVKKENSTGST